MTLVNALQRIFCELIVLLSCHCHSVYVEYYANAMTPFLNAGHCLDLHTLPWCIQLSAIFLSIPALILVTLSATCLFSCRFGSPSTHSVRHSLLSLSFRWKQPTTFVWQILTVLQKLFLGPLFPRVSGTRTSSLIRGAVNPFSPTARLPPQSLSIQKTSVSSFSSSCLYLKTYKPYAEDSYESK